MALTRKFLKALEIEGDKAEQIIEAHAETLEGLKTSLEAAKAEAGRLPDLQTQLEAAQTQLEAAQKDSYKVKYQALKEEWDAYQAQQAQKEARTAKETAYRALLKEAGISEKRVESVLRVSDVEGVELDEKGRVRDAKDRLKALKEEWADFIPTTRMEGAQIPNPPASMGDGTMTKDEIMNISDVEARQKAMAEHAGLFNI